MCRRSWTLVAVALAVLLPGRVRAAASDTQTTGHRLIDVPYLPQTPELCGGAALAMVMRYWGDRTVLPVDFQSLVSSSKGIVTTDLVQAVSRRGWTAIASTAPTADPLDTLSRQVDLGRPVIVLLEVSSNSFHYVVVVGLTADRVVFHDPARTAFRVQNRDAFEQAWRGGDRWALVVLPPADRARALGDLPAPAPTTHGRPGACGALVDHAVGLADSDAAGAETALNTALSLCPADADPWLELAGLRFREARWHDAARLAERATDLAPDDADAWALLATARFLNNDEAGALEAWNHLGQPTIDLINISGAHRTPQPALAHLIGLEAREVLTPDGLHRAQREFSEAPSAYTTRLTFVPHDDTQATVSAAMVERDPWPRKPMALLAIATRAVFSDDIRVIFADLLGAGETVTGTWRWPVERPRVGLMINLPAPGPLRGMITIDGFWEKQTYLLPMGGGATTPFQDDRRRGTFNLGTWLSGMTRIDLGAGIDRLGTSDYLTLHGAIEEHVGGDHLVGRLDGEIWRLGPGGGFSTQNASLTWSSDPNFDHASLWGVGGLWDATASAPLDLWMGAGTGQGRPVLLRAHPLLHDNSIRGSFFGRQLAFSTTEFDRPLRPTVIGMLSAAAFVDSARAWHGLNGLESSPTEVDTGVGFRLRVKGGGLARVDVARGLIDGGWVLSAGWTYGSRIAFSRGTPW